MGLFDMDNNDFFGGLFDFDGDGKTSFDEEFLAYKMFEEMTKDDDSSFDPEPLPDDFFDVGPDITAGNCGKPEADYGWRDFCEDGSEFGIYPEDFETEWEYVDALEEAKYGWRDGLEGFEELGIVPEDFETPEEYKEALEAAMQVIREKLLQMGIDPDNSSSV